ncbi:hypothetical protein ACFVWR_04265 [Leifsonia sp. NPDC058292]|uniref:hypothetical protein n=1 Tax=Leifsonia sp. NPDC058292 TaxID=3346428 RepID=UPI0036DC4A4B
MNAELHRGMNPVRAPGRPGIVVPIVSLLATADMAVPAITVLPAPVWIALLLTLSAWAARRGRRSGAAQLAAEPFAMALMVVLGLLFAHRGHSAGPGVMGLVPHAHPGAGGGVAPITVALALSVVVLGIGCLASAVRATRRIGLVRGLLPLSSAVAMCAMTTWMLVPR